MNDADKKIESIIKNAEWWRKNSLLLLALLFIPMIVFMVVFLYFYNPKDIFLKLDILKNALKIYAAYSLLLLGSSFVYELLKWKKLK